MLIKMEWDLLIRVWVSGEKSFAFQRLPRAMQVFYGIILGTKKGSKEELGVKGY